MAHLWTRREGRGLKKSMSDQQRTRICRAIPGTCFELFEDDFVCWMLSA